MEEYKLFDAEYRLMELVWNLEPVNSTALARRCEAELGWKKSTTYTVLKKLGERGLVQNEESVVTALASRETVTAEAAEAFVDKTFNGSLPGFLAAFMGGRKLTEREAEDLKRLIDQYQEG